MEVACQSPCSLKKCGFMALAPKKVKNLLILALKLILAVGLIAWLVSSGKLDFYTLKNLLEPHWILIGLSIVATNWFFAAERWRGILQTQGFSMSSWQTMRLTMIGGFFNFAIPGGVGGDVVKGYYLARDNPQDRLRAVVTIAIDRLLGLFSMVLMALIVMTYDYKLVLSRPELRFIGAGLIALFLGFMMFWVLIFSRRLVNSGVVIKILEKLPLSETTTKIYHSFAVYKDIKKAFFKAIMWSFLSQVAGISLFIFNGWVLGFNDVSLHTYFFVVPLGFMVMAIPISPAGVGVGQAAFYFLFNLTLQNPSSIGSATITAHQIFNFLFGLFGAIFYVTSKKRLPKDATSAIPTIS